jgi:UDP-N-acetyl-D-glucosamine dehydrogenase
LDRLPKQASLVDAAGACAASLIERCSNRTALVGVIGLGYVGLPLALRFSEAGFE